jgi:hypothetical protein
MSMGAFAMILLENALLPDEALVSDELKLVLALIAGGALWFVTTQAEHLIVQIFGAAAGTAVGAMVYNVAAHLAFVAPGVPHRLANGGRVRRLRWSWVHGEGRVHSAVQHQRRVLSDERDVVLHVEARGEPRGPVDHAHSVAEAFHRSGGW